MKHNSVVESPDLTVHVVSGVVRADELRDKAIEFLTVAPTPLALWDFSEADFSELTTPSLVLVFDALVPYMQNRRGGKSALLFQSTVGFGLGRLSEALAEVREFPYEFKAFSNREDALLWLKMPNGRNGEETNGDEGVA